MTDTLALDQPVGVDAVGDNSLIHRCCCDDDVAMCGVDLAGGSEIYAVVQTERLCVPCEVALEQGWPCPVPGCPGDRS